MRGPLAGEPGAPPTAVTAARPDDRVLWTTRALALVIVPFLVAASAILWVWPTRTARLFAWPVRPPMTSMMLAAAYLGGIYFFVRAAVARQWHQVKIGFPPVTAFAATLGVTTVLHWNRFTLNHVSFWTWAGLYFTTPFLVVAAWLANRRTDPGVRAPGDPAIPQALRSALGAVGYAILAVSLLLFLAPSLMVPLWPWKLSVLTARVMSAMFALPGFVLRGIAVDERWSSARVILEAQLSSIALILVAAVRSRADLAPMGVAAALFLGGLGALWLGIGGLYLAMEARRKASS